MTTLDSGVCEHCGATGVPICVCGICGTHFCTKSPRHHDSKLQDMCSWYHEGWPGLVDVFGGDHFMGCSIRTRETLELNPDWERHKPKTLSKQLLLPEVA